SRPRRRRHTRVARARAVRRYCRRRRGAAHAADAVRAARAAWPSRRGRRPLRHPAARSDRAQPGGPGDRQVGAVPVRAARRGGGFLTTRSGHDGGDMKELSGDAILSLPLRLHGIELGRPVDLLLDRASLRVVGLDVLCGDEVHRFLPLPTAAVGDDVLTIHSPLVLLDEDELAFYRSGTFY